MSNNLLRVVQFYFILLREIPEEVGSAYLGLILCLLWNIIATTTAWIKGQDFFKRNSSVTPTLQASKRIAQKEWRTDFVPAYVRLLRDNEAEVRIAAAGKVTKFSRIFGLELTIQHILPCVKGSMLLLNDEFPDVRLNIISDLNRSFVPIFTACSCGTGLRQTLENYLVIHIGLYRYIRYKELCWDLEQLIGSGGMPPSHSATVTAFAVAFGLHDGLGSSTFATALILACIVMYDATSEGFMLGAKQRPLRELLGHTPPQNRRRMLVNKLGVEEVYCFNAPRLELDNVIYHFEYLDLNSLDWGGEFRNLSTFFTSLGILHRLSCPHTSEQNGLVERRHRHVVETGLTLLSQSAVPTKFWHFAYDTAVYLINRMPSRNSSNTSPFEHIFKRKPDFSFLKVFGCQCYPHLRPYNKHKMDFRSIPCVFLGYSPSHHGYRCLYPTSNRLYIARHVRFNEQCFPFTIPSPSSSPTPFPSPDPYVSSYPCGLIPSDSILQSPTPPPPTPQTTGAKLPTPPSTTVVPPLDPPSDTAILTQQPDTAVTPPRRVRPPSLCPNPKQHMRYNPYAYFFFNGNFINTLARC
ncbi:putative RNA-directed DNA polymerase [Tanacetum coccineum]